VQRGDAEMSQKLWRVVRSCVELGARNPLVQIHDQGAGGNCNVVKEIIYPLGGEIDVRAVKVRVALCGGCVRVVLCGGGVAARTARQVRPMALFWWRAAPLGALMWRRHAHAAAPL
jgi:hypothetical protein